MRVLGLIQSRVPYPHIAPRAGVVSRHMHLPPAIWILMDEANGEGRIGRVRIMHVPDLQFATLVPHVTKEAESERHWSVGVSPGPVDPNRLQPPTVAVTVQTVEVRIPFVPCVAVWIAGPVVPIRSAPVALDVVRDRTAPEDALQTSWAPIARFWHRNLDERMVGPRHWQAQWHPSRYPHGIHNRVWILARLLPQKHRKNLVLPLPDEAAEIGGHRLRRNAPSGPSSSPKSGSHGGSCS